jgi:AcrR family transcriptional regulator
MGRKKAYIRDEVLEKALELFWKMGYEGSHLQDLVEHTGLNRFSLYKEFGGKEGLFDESLTLYLDSLEGALQSLTKDPQGLNTILSFFQKMDLKFFIHGCFLINSLADKYTIQKNTYARALEWVNRFDKAIEMNLQISKDKGELIDLPIDAIKRFIVTVDSGITIMSINHSAQELDGVFMMIEHFLNSLKR